MSSNQTIVRQFWSHVFHSPKKTATFVRNMAKESPQVIISPMGMPGITPTTVFVDPPKYREVSWEQSALIVAEVMFYLKECGVRKGDRVAILAWNSPEWIWLHMAILSLGAASVPIYPNSASEQVNYILSDSGTKLIFAEDANQLNKIDTKGGVRRVLLQDAFRKTIDYNGSSIPEGTPTNTPRELNPSSEAARLVGEILAQLPQENFLGIGQSDLAVLIYTSGSTGVPKGVIQLHKTISSACMALGRHGFTFTDRDVYLSYLPLAHIYEQVNGSSLCMWYGVPSAYCSVEDMAEVVKDIKPTILLGVPKVWRKVKGKADEQLSAATGLKAKLINWALKQDKPGFSRCIADFLVFKKIRAALGGRVRLLLSGGAPIADDILEFFTLTGLPLRQGYGLTESAGGCTVNTLENNKTGSVGRPIDCVQVHIEPMEGQPEGRGVIWLKGDSITPGYWKLPEANEASFKDGWFNTGDIGYVDEDGYLWITGRAKRLMKTDGGKYVPMEKLEHAFDAVDLIDFVVPVGDGLPFIGALFFLEQQVAASMLKEAGVTIPSNKGDRPKFFSEHPLILEAVKKAVDAANTTFERWETIKQWSIVPVEATVENGLMTTKRTIKSERVMVEFQDMVDEIYSRKKPS